MPTDSFSLFNCICGGQKRAKGLVSIEPSGQAQPLTTQPLTYQASSGGGHHEGRCTEFEVQCLLQIQRILGGLRGTWLPKAHAVLSHLSVFLNAVDVSFYGALATSKGGSSSSCFVLLARESGDGAETCKDGKGVPLPGFEVWPANERVKADGHGCTPDALRPATTAGADLQSQEACQRLMPAMLDRLLATQAPVIQVVTTPAAGPTLGVGAASPGPTLAGAAAAAKLPGSGGGGGGAQSGVVALVPLAVGDQIAGALWLVQYGTRPDTASVSAPATPDATELQRTGSVSKSAPPVGDSASYNSSSGGAADADAKAGGVAASLPRCPGLISSPQALQQLSLSASMCLLGSETRLAGGLVDSLHQLSAAGCLQRLVAGLCDALAAHVRERFLLEPRIFAALVPEPASAVGLMFNRTPPAAAAGTPVVSRAAPRVPCTTALARSCSGGVGVGGMCGEAVGPGEVRRDGGGAQPQSLRVVTAAPGVGLRCKEPSPLGARPKSGDANARAVVMAGATAASTAGAPPPPTRAPVRMPVSQRVFALAQSELSIVEASTAAALGSGAGTSGSFVTLRVKPFPLAQTLLRHVVRKVAAAAAGPGAVPAAPAGSCRGGCAARGSGGGSGFHARAIEVADCPMLVQDPKKPSRDVLLLIASSGASSAPPLTPSGSGIGPAASLASCSTGGGGGGLTGSSGGGSFTSGRRVVSSLLLLVLPAGDGKAMLGFYVTFPQHLPQPLLRRARTDLLEILEVLSPVVSRKFTSEVSLELQTLATAAPGSYAVVEAPEVENCSAASVGAGDPLDGVFSARARPKFDGGAPESDGGGPGERVLPMYSPLVQSFLCDSRDVGAGSSTAPGGPSGGGGGSLTMGHSRSINLMDTAASPNVLGENTVGMVSLLSAHDSALAASIHPNNTITGIECLTRSTVIHLEELDMVQSTMRAQMPLLVASMQSSISNARVEAAMAAAAASTIRTGGSFATSPSAPRLSFGADHGDLAQLELHSQLGHGGCAVVFKGTLGTLDCAVKLMEMPDVDGTGNGDPSALDKRPGGGAIASGNTNGSSGDDLGGGGGGGGGGGDESNSSLAARRALLRNAMELAAMTSISHPNIMQVYSTFSNVTLGRRAQPNGTDHFYLKTLDGSGPSSHPDSPPICVAIVCEWCDKGCLGSALQKGAFPTLLPSPRKGGPRSPAASSGSGRSASRSLTLDFKGILMTLLDVAMALRHLHSHHLIHRDVKPANVLLKSNVMDPRGFTAKLADFGFVTLLNQPADERSGGEPFVYVDETCGTVTHMAPECWREKPTRLDASYDVYSFGILMWEMTAGGLRPYPEVPPSNIARAVKRGLRPVFDDGIPIQYRFLAQRCWTADPTCRPRTSELVTTISQLLSRM